MTNTKEYKYNVFILFANNTFHHVFFNRSPGKHFFKNCYSTYRKVNFSCRAIQQMVLVVQYNFVFVTTIYSSGASAQKCDSFHTL